jgi:hypothetical protein
MPPKTTRRHVAKWRPCRNVARPTVYLSASAVGLCGDLQFVAGLRGGLSKRDSKRFPLTSAGTNVPGQITLTNCLLCQFERTFHSDTQILLGLTVAPSNV